jgi:hypothetical protein
MGSAMAASTGASPTTVAADQSTLADIEQAAGIDAIPADYVILCDTSGSMQAGGLFTALREQLGDFLAAMAPGDTVTLITFDSVATTAYQGLAGTDPTAIVSRLPPTAGGGYTDIGAAIAAAVRTLSRPNASDIATVVLITDGQHVPPPGSAYPLTEGVAWDELRSQVSALGQQSLSGYALPLGVEAVSGAGLLASVIPSTTTLDAAAVTEVSRLLEQPKADVRAAKVAAALADDLGRGVGIFWPGSVVQVSEGQTEVIVTLTARTEKIPLTVSDLRVAADQPGLTVTPDVSRFEIPPGESRRVRLTVTWNFGARSLMYRDERAVDAMLTLTGKVDSPWRETLASDLRISFDPPAISSGMPARGVVEVGSPALWYGGGAGLLVFLLLLALWLRTHPRLGGVLEIISPRNELIQVKLSRLRAKKVLRGMPLSGDVLERVAPLTVRVRRGKHGRQLFLAFTTRIGEKHEKRRELIPPGRLHVVRGVSFRWQPKLRRVTKPLPSIPRPVVPEPAVRPVPPLGPPPVAQRLGRPPVAPALPSAAPAMPPVPVPAPPAGPSPTPVQPRPSSPPPVPPSPLPGTTGPTTIVPTQPSNAPVSPPAASAEPPERVDADGPSFRFD